MIDSEALAPLPQWLDRDAAIKHCTAGIGIGKWDEHGARRRARPRARPRGGRGDARDTCRREAPARPLPGAQGVRDQRVRGQRRGRHEPEAAERAPRFRLSVSRAFTSSLKRRSGIARFHRRSRARTSRSPHGCTEAQGGTYRQDQVRYCRRRRSRSVASAARSIRSQRVPSPRCP